MTKTMSLSNIMTNHNYFAYCKEERPIYTYHYTWEIPNFLHEYTCSLISPEIESQPFHFQLDHDEKTQNLYFDMVFKKPIVGRCYVSIKNTEINFCQIFKSIKPSSKRLMLGNIPIIYLLENAANCLPNNTLTVCFKCQIYAVKSQNVLCANISYTESEKDSTKITNDNNDDIVPDQESLVTFVIGDKRLYANKNLICAKSTVFQTMFNSQMKEKVTNEVVITDTTYDILKLFLSYIQFTVLPNLATDDAKTLSELLIIADKYNTEDLKLLCEIQLIKLINSENYVEFLSTTWLHNTKYLKDYIKEFMHLQKENIDNSQIAKMIESSESFLRTIKHSKANEKVLFSVQIYNKIYKSDT